jgi:hypothetical protein
MSGRVTESKAARGASVRTDSALWAARWAGWLSDCGLGRASMIRRDAVIDDGVPLHVLRGRMMYGRKRFRRTTYLFVTLAVYRSGIGLRSTYSWLSRIVPIWRARYEELSVVKSVGRPDPDGSERRQGTSPGERRPVHRE